MDSSLLQCANGRAPRSERTLAWTLDVTCKAIGIGGVSPSMCSFACSCPLATRPSAFALDPIQAHVKQQRGVAIRILNDGLQRTGLLE